MERLNSQHETVELSREQLEALADALFERADAGAFLVLNKILEGIRNE